MKIKSLIIVALTASFMTPTAFAGDKKKKEAQAEPEGYKFEVVVEHPITPLKNQSSSGTCWAFSALSFFESEIIKAGYQGDVDLSEMFVVHHTYMDRAIKYVRLHGDLNFGPGGSFGLVYQMMKNYGIVPEKVMTGLNYGTERHQHGELDAILTAYVNAVLTNKNKTLTPAWKKGFEGVLNAYLGEIPESFEYNGKNYTPKSYLQSLKINMDDYVDITSFTHHPFYEKMAIEVQDNWNWAQSYNVPIDELIKIMDNALENGYTIAWAADVSEGGFSSKGLGIVPDFEKMEGTGSDQARWIGLSKEEKASKASDAPCPEKVITQEMRQEAYDNYQTTDDHGMHIYGIAKDQNGKKYYMVKNSWGTAGKYKGFWYVSEAYVRYKTMNIMINKNGIPSDIKAKLHL